MSCTTHGGPLSHNAHEQIGLNEAETGTGQQACPSRLDGCDATHEVDASVTRIVGRTG